MGSPDKFLNYFEVNPNTTRYAVVWCTDVWEINIADKFKGSIPCQFDQPEMGEMIFYTIWSNRTLTPDVLFKPVQMPLPKDLALLQLQNSIDNAILKHLHMRSGNAETKTP